MTKLHEINQLGQSVWYDNIRRALLDSGELAAYIEDGVSGLTSNPSIFKKAIADSSDYDEALRQLVQADKSVDEIYEALALDDIGRAADLLRPVYERTGGADGYVSIEVSHTLAHDTENTISEARRLFATLERPNIMIKVPATPAGMPAIEALIGAGINVNATLIFSLGQYEAVAHAYVAGLEQLAKAGGDLSRVASVASFFISRVDSAVDKALQTHPQGAPLMGKTAIANAKAAYARFGEIFDGERCAKLVAQGARVQRPLWASTSTKNPDYPDTLYIDELIGPDTVNTVPPSTLKAVLDHGRVAPTLEAGLDEVLAHLARLPELDVDLDAVTQDLLDKGVASFAQAFESLLESVAARREQLL